MFNNNKLAKSIRLAIAFGAAATFASASALANETSDEDLLEEEEAEVITITGSRIRRAEFSSASPIQVIDGQISREMGLFDASEILQSTSQSSGLQIDNSFGGFVLDNGPGASTIGFRGLGAERTLVLVNGRRMAPAGVGGAPTAPDLNLIPAVMVDRVENLFDGASTIYGSDAVAGVANLILRTDVEGFEIQANIQNPKGDGADEKTVSMMWGTTSDNGYITFGAEYQDRKAQTVGENPFISGCNDVHYETPDGQILDKYRGLGPVPDSWADSCKLSTTNRLYIPTFMGNIWRTPGETNFGVPNFSETTLPAGFEVYSPNWFAGDSNGDGVLDNSFIDADKDGYVDLNLQDPYYNFAKSDYAQSSHLYSPLERFSLFSNGEYDLGDANDTRVYYEALYAKRNSDVFNAGSQFFEDLPASNPINPCGVYGVDCYGTDLNAIGFFAGPLDVTPIHYVRGDREYNNVEVYQYRAVGGITGNIGALDNFGQGNWYYDASYSYSSSNGKNSLTGLGEQQVINSFNATLDDDGNLVCVDQSDGCVAWDFFADRMWQEGGGVLSEEEAEYLFVTRKQETIIKQSVFNAFIGGDAFTLPWNNEVVPVVLGVEIRNEEIESNFNDVTTQGLLWGYSTDKGANGSRYINEAFGEAIFPLLKGQPFAEELTLTASARWTDEEFSDPESTYSLKALYRPVEYFTLRATKGTSYRTPNLRERFLAGTTGFNNVTDYCVVPEAARDQDELDPNAPIVYNESNDTRDSRVIASCTANGVDPTALGIQQGDDFLQNTNTEIVSGGTENVNEEHSEATTMGFVFEQPWFESFDLTLSVTKFDIEITDSIVEPGRQYIIDQCYNNPEQPNGESAYCDRITRGSNGAITSIDAQFINIGLLTAKGYDYNIRYDQDFLIGDKNLSVVADIIATKNTESMIDIAGAVDDNLGEPSQPEWRGQALLSFSYSDFTFRWATRYIAGGEEDDLGEFEEDDIACDGLEVTCRPVAYTDDYWKHDTSLSYSMDNFTVNFGVQNVFNEAPPRIDTSGTFGVNNIPLGVGYDLLGRTAYLSVGVDF